MLTYVGVGRFGESGGGELRMNQHLWLHHEACPCEFRGVRWVNGIRCWMVMGRLVYVEVGGCV